jgi:hypothetical protein
MNEPRKIDLTAEFHRADRWHGRIQVAIEQIRKAEAIATVDETTLEARHAILKEDDFRAEIEREIARTRETHEQLAMIELDLEGQLTTEEREKLYEGLSVMVDRPGDLIGRTDRGVKMMFPWSDEGTARALSSVAAGIAAHELPDRKVRFGYQMLDASQPEQTAMTMTPAPRRAAVAATRGRSPH